jgi:hypothetical protein
VIADLTPTVRERCMEASLRLTPDRRGFFGYNDNFKAYVEVISFDRLLDGAPAEPCLLRLPGTTG